MDVLPRVKPASRKPVISHNDNSSRNESPSRPVRADILVAGSVAVDLSCDYVGGNGASSPVPNLHTSNPAKISQSIGGVGRNVALAAHRVTSEGKVKLCTLIGDDL